MTQLGTARARATLTARLIRKDGSEQQFTVPAEIRHPWKKWQQWWWTRVLKRPLPWRGRVPKFTLW